MTDDIIEDDVYWTNVTSQYQALLDSGILVSILVCVAART